MKFSDTFYAIRKGRLFYRYITPNSNEREWTTRFDEAKLYHDRRQAVSRCNQLGVDRTCIKAVTVTTELAD